MRVAIPFIALFLVSCGGGSGSGSGPQQIELRSSGLNPSALSSPSGGQVQFVNHDTVDHQIASSNCTELASPKLSANGTFTATLGTGPKSCTFNDALNATNAAFQGNVSVAAPGAGY